MAGAARWLAAACALAACGDAVAKERYITWPDCSTMFVGAVAYEFEVVEVVHVQPGQTDTKATGVYFDDCYFRKINFHSLMKYPNTRYIVLKGIELINQTALSLDPFANLEMLVMNSNSLLGKYLPANLFRNCRRLHHINFSENDMSDAPADLLQGLDQLKSLILYDCGLREVPSFFTSQKFPHLEEIHISDSEISEIASTTFAKAVNLTFLNLSRNKIANLNTYFIKPLTKLKSIILSGNRLRDIPETFFQYKPFLEHVHLPNNQIENIPLNAFLGANLTTLFLNDNNLMHLPTNFMSNLVATGIIPDVFSFYGNPWECACLNNLLVKVKELSINYPSYIYNGQSPACRIRAIVIQNNNCS